MPQFKCYWRVVAPETPVAVAFGPVAAGKYGPDKTLWDGLHGRGDVYLTLLREATAALLNSYNSFSFVYPTVGVVSDMNLALLGSRREALAVALRFRRANFGISGQSLSQRPAAIVYKNMFSNSPSSATLIYLPLISFSFPIKAHTLYMEFLPCFPCFLFLALPCFLPSSTLAADIPLPGTIDRTTKQQIITTLTPGEPSTTEPFLTSPGGKYAAHFLRRATVPGAGGFGNDFCYIQIQDSGTGESMWESDCAPVSTSNACSLVFSDSGLDIFDGSSSAWSTGAASANGNPLRTLELVDEGDMRIRDNAGELAWKASDDPRQNQNCGEPGSPGLSPALPPFAEPVGGSTNMPFGQQQPGGAGHVPPVPDGGDGEQDAGGIGRSFGLSGQPLVDSTPYDSGSFKRVEDWIGFGSAFFIGLTGLEGLLF
ncbi:hypothetical protein KSP40_PGU001243 [Platanthera guangdongensis]|uniref:Bulb-type lectin domain-containing protein n=1 Tax=Platanthera guangdongensis TaxID=2320717 RepID=A0ABR2MTX8_9ASPA